MIGIFDSGIGGMTVAKAIEQLLPNIPQIYLGDLARSPYGPKSGATITQYAIENSRFLLEKGAQLIVIACNSAASVATEALRREFNVPIFEVITPAVNAAASLTTTGKIGVIGTRATIRSDVYRQKLQALNPEYKIVSQACPLLVPLIEEGWCNRQETKMVLKRYLHPLKQHQVDTLVLGCTHYPLLRHLIAPRMGHRVQLVDSSITTAKFLQANMAPELMSACHHNNHTPDRNQYWVTDILDSAPVMAEKIFQRPVELRLVS